MTRDELLELFDRTVADCRRTLQEKNHDYTADGGPFDNFLVTEKVFDVKAEIGLLMRVMDKIQRIKTYLLRGKLKVRDEGLVDAVKDNINYMVLLLGLIREKEQIKHGRLSAD